MPKIKNLMERFVADLKLKGYAKRTIQSYQRAAHQLRNYYGHIPIEEITEEQVRGYLLFCKDSLKWETSTQRIAYNGIKLFFTLTLKRDWELLCNVKYQRSTTLPVVLNIDEVRKILASLNTPLSYAYFSLVYSCGLRLNEAIHLKVADIDGKRKCVHIHHGKRAHDRVIPLADTTLEILRDYWKTHRNPVWMFPSPGRTGREGHTATKPVSVATLYHALKKATTYAGVRKHVTTHTLRHSYATHMLDAGVSVLHVQKCLGHKSLETTMIYLHVTTHGQEDSRRRLNLLVRAVMT